MVEDQSLEVLATILAEQEAVDLGAQLLEGEVGRSKQSTAGVVGAVVGVKETSLAKSQLEGRELRRQEVNDLEGSWRGNEKVVNSVNHSVCTEDVDGNDTRVEVEGQALETKVDAESLRGLTRQVLTLHECGDGVSNKDSASRVKVVTDVVLDELLDHLLARLVVRRVIGESSVLGSEDGEVTRAGRVQLLNEIGVLADELGELLGILGRAEQLPDGLVGLVTMVRASIMRRRMMRWFTVVRIIVVRRVWVLVMAVQGIVCVVGSRLEPRLGIESSLLELGCHGASKVRCRAEGFIESVLGIV